jgi:hypothetical protein
LVPQLRRQVSLSVALPFSSSQARSQVWEAVRQSRLQAVAPTEVSTGAVGVGGLRGLSGALARLERHTELYLAAIPDLTPVTAAPIEPASAADPPRESEGSTTITGTSASASATAPAAASPATRARARGTSWVAGAGIGAAAGLAFYLASGGGGAGSVGVGAVSGAAAALALRWMSLKRET